MTDCKAKRKKFNDYSWISSNISGTKSCLYLKKPVYFLGLQFLSFSFINIYFSHLPKFSVLKTTHGFPISLCDDIVLILNNTNETKVTWPKYQWGKNFI